MSKKPKNKPTSALFRRNFFWNFLGSSCYTFLSLIFLIIITHINGVNDAGIFSFAFSAACVFAMIGVYSGRTFQITDKDKRFSDSDYFYSKIVTCFAMLATAIIFSLLRGYDFDKFIIMLFLVLYKLLEAFSESTYAVIQNQDKLYQVGRSLFAKAILSLAAFLIVDLVTKSLVFTCISIFLANLAVVILYDLSRLRAAGFALKRCDFSKVFMLLKRGLFTFGFTFLNLYLVQAAKFAIDSSATNDIQAYYGIVAMPATVITLFSQYVIQPFLTTLKKTLAKDLSLFVRLTIKLLLAVCAFGVLCVLVALPLGIPVLQLLYGIELPDCLIPLLIILLGSTINASVLVLSTALITMRVTFSQFVAYLITAILALIISPILVTNLSLLGASLSYLIVMATLFILYLIIFRFVVYQFHNVKKE